MSTEAFRQDLLDTGLLVNSGISGVYERSFAFESIVRGLEAYVSAATHVPEPHRLFFPPIMPRDTLVSSGYVSSFPDLAGIVSGFSGTDRDLPSFLTSLNAGDDWTSHFSPLDVAMCSAACHNIYPHYAHQSIPVEGLLYEVQGVCFRHEPSADPARMQSFRMHEFVFLGTPEGALAHRDTWLALGARLLADLGLELEVVVANDPFFGRVGRVLANGQLEKELKFEVTAPISSDRPGAIASGNYHEDHMSTHFNISLEGGGTMHSACFAFGLDRIALALLHTHGTRLDSWPTTVRTSLSLPATRTAT
jgi:seryl-tRNA synthetase